MNMIVCRDTCQGCGLCVKSCPFAAIQIIDQLAVISPDCTQCGACISSCPYHALEKPEKASTGYDLSGYQGVWVFAQYDADGLCNVSLELLGEGAKLAAARRTELCAVLCGDGACAELADQLIGYGADKVYLITAPELAAYTNDGYVRAVYEAIDRFSPEILLLGATPEGRDLAPSLAAKCHTGLTADCTELAIDPTDGKLLQTRPAFGGNLLATIICPRRRPQMATVRPGVMDKAVFNGERQGTIIPISLSFTAQDIRARIIELIPNRERTASLADAQIVVAGGLGLGTPEGFDLLRRLAAVLGGSIAASRACVDSGWISHAYQVGQTGLTIKPKLYIACGISGAIQHVAGMQNAECIVAIDKNQQAPIFAVADYGIVGDLYEVIPALIQALEQ